MSQVTLPDEYKVLFLLNEQNEQLREILNHNGAANLTVCPECHADDFVHVEGCKLGDECYALAGDNE